MTKVVAPRLVEGEGKRFVTTAGRPFFGPPARNQLREQIGNRRRSVFRIHGYCRTSLPAEATGPKCFPVSLKRFRITEVARDQHEQPSR